MFKLSPIKQDMKREGIGRASFVTNSTFDRHSLGHSSTTTRKLSTRELSIAEEETDFQNNHHRYIEVLTRPESLESRRMSAPWRIQNHGQQGMMAESVNMIVLSYLCN